MDAASEQLRLVIEAEKEKLDVLQQLALDRSTLEFNSALADINSAADDFEAGLRADRERAERDQEALASLHHAQHEECGRPTHGVLPRQHADALRLACSDTGAVSSSWQLLPRQQTHYSRRGALCLHLGIASRSRGL